MELICVTGDSVPETSEASEYFEHREPIVSYLIWNQQSQQLKKGK